MLARAKVTRRRKVEILVGQSQNVTAKLRPKKVGGGEEAVNRMKSARAFAAWTRESSDTRAIHNAGTSDEMRQKDKFDRTKRSVGGK